MKRLTTAEIRRLVEREIRLTAALNELGKHYSNDALTTAIECVRRELEEIRERLR